MTISVRHTGIVVQNLEEALVFWRDLLGFSVTRAMNEAGPFIDAMMGLQNTKVTTVKMSAPLGGGVELLCFTSHPDLQSWGGTPYSTGYTHLALQVEDLHVTYKKLIKNGIEFISVPQQSLDGKVKVAFCKGPESILLELVEVLN